MTPAGDETGLAGGLGWGSVACAAQSAVHTSSRTTVRRLFADGISFTMILAAQPREQSFDNIMLWESSGEVIFRCASLQRGCRSLNTKIIAPQFTNVQITIALTIKEVQT